MGNFGHCIHVVTDASGLATFVGLDGIT
jgi:hypothetical protein